MLGTEGTRLSSALIFQPAKPVHPRRSVAMVMKILAEGFGVFVLTLVLMVVFSMFLHGI
jgi:hypothetical protein